MASQSSNYDIIIIGAGPGGSTAAYLFARKNFKVLLVDKANFPRDKLCGGLLSYKTVKLIERIYNIDINDLIQNNVIDYHTPFYKITYKNKRIISKNIAENEFYLVNRRVYDNFLLTKAKDLGVEVKEGVKIKRIDIENCRIELNNGETIISKILIGADGANSIVRREFIRKNLIKNKDWQFNLATGLECFVKRTDLENHKFKEPMITFGFVQYGYNWLFPNKDKIILGVGALNRRNKGYFRTALMRFISSFNIDLTKISPIEGHPVPYGNFSVKPFYKNKVLLIGDAAGIVDPLWGEGIYYTQKTAEFATIAIINSLKGESSSLEYYETLLRKHVYSEFKYTLKLRWIIYNKLSVYSNYYIPHILIAIFRKKLIDLIHGKRSYKWLLKKQIL